MNFEPIVEKIRTDIGSRDAVPGFDPENGNQKAKFLFLLEAPGPKAVVSKCISMNNPDPTARNFKKQIELAQISKGEIAIWNVVPWYIGKEENSYKKIRAAKTTDIEQGVTYLSEIINKMPNLKCIVLVGEKARKAHVALSKITTARILSCHHPSGQSMNGKPEKHQDNIDVFHFMSSQ